MYRREFLATAAAAIVLPAAKLSAAAERHLLYIAEPGIRNYVEYGGVGVLVYDIDDGYKFVKRIPTWSVAERAASRRTSRASPPARRPAGSTSAPSDASAASIFATEKMVWERELEGGCDRMAISPDGKIDVRAVAGGTALERRRRA